MGLQIILEPGQSELEDLCRPVVICDWCNEQITEAADGNYEWVMSEFGKAVMASPIVFTHKRCSHAFEESMGRGNGRWFGAIGLECLPVYMAHNLHIDWHKAERSATWCAGYSFEEVSARLPQEEWLKVRQRVFRRDGYVCRYCGRSGPGVVLHCDHIIPISKGGSNEISNLVTSCATCNLNKRARTVTGWLGKEMG